MCAHRTGIVQQVITQPGVSFEQVDERIINGSAENLCPLQVDMPSQILGK